MGSIMAKHVDDFPQIIKISRAVYVALPKDFMANNGLEVHSTLHRTIDGNRIILEAPHD